MRTNQHDLQNYKNYAIFGNLHKWFFYIINICFNLVFNLALHNSFKNAGKHVVTKQFLNIRIKILLGQLCLLVLMSNKQ